MKSFSLSLRQFTVVSLLGLAIWLKSPLVALAVVATLAIKESREFLEHKTKVIELESFQRKLDAQEEEIRQVRNEINRMVTRHAQTFGE